MSRPRRVIEPREAFRAGLRAFNSGQLASMNPHYDWRLGVAWASGWHFTDGLTYELARQVKVARWTTPLLEGWAA